MGAWIETYRFGQDNPVNIVAPCVGAWIETLKPTISAKLKSVAPCVGAWIETALYDGNGPRIEVAPCVDAWIETGHRQNRQPTGTSHPAWVRGLKLYSFDYFLLHLRRTLRGCVD